MEENQGWVKSYRKMLDNPIICKDSETFAIWNYLLLNATHKEMNVYFKNDKVTLKKGQLITGILVIAKKFKINKDKVQRTLKSFESDKQIEQITSNKNRLISILNWDKYQTIDNEIDKQMINKRETTDKQLITNKNVNNDKNDKNDKNVNKIYYENSELNSIFEEYLDVRKKLKLQNTDRIITRLKNTLSSYEDNIKIKMLEKAITCDWKDLYPLNEKEIKATKQTFTEMMQEIYNDLGGETNDNTRND